MNSIHDPNTDILILSDDPSYKPVIKSRSPSPPKNLKKEEFVIFTTATAESFYTGHILEFKSTDNYNIINKKIRQLIDFFRRLRNPRKLRNTNFPSKRGSIFTRPKSRKKQLFTASSI